MCRQSMQTKAMAPSRQIAAAWPSVSCKKAGELGRGHLPDAHGELAVADAPEPADMAVDRHVVGRIGEDEVGALVRHESLRGSRRSRESPQIRRCRPSSQRSPGRVTADLRESGGMLVLRSRPTPTASSPWPRRGRDRPQRERSRSARHRSRDRSRRLQLDRQHLPVPAGVQRELVVGDAHRPGAGLR